MFARKLRIELTGEERRPVPREWLEQFFLRDFTGSSAFDETLPAGDGVLEAGLRVDAERVRSELERWLRGRKMIGAGTGVAILGS